MFDYLQTCKQCLGQVAYFITVQCWHSQQHLSSVLPCAGGRGGDGAAVAAADRRRQCPGEIPRRRHAAGQAQDPGE